MAWCPGGATAGRGRSRGTSPGSRRPVPPGQRAIGRASISPRQVGPNEARRDAPKHPNVATFRSQSDTLSDMWEPVGPLAASVYWRRRFTAVVVAVLLIGAATCGAAALLTRPATTSPADGTTILAPS